MGKTLMFLNPRKRKGRRSSARRRTHHRKHKMFSNPRKGRKRSSGRRRSAGSRRGFGLGGITGSVKQAFSKEIVMTGVGLFATQTTLAIINARYGLKRTGGTDKDPIYESKLPMAGTPVGAILYGVGIPVVLGMVTRKYSMGFSNGAYLAAVSGLINAYVAPAISSEVKKLAGTSAYVSAGLPNITGVGRISGRPRLAPVGNLPGFPAIYPTNSMARR